MAEDFTKVSQTFHAVFDVVAKVANFVRPAHSYEPAQPYDTCRAAA
jgi:hypothetical protein